MFKNRILFFLFGTMLLFQSCLKDDLGFPEDEDPAEVTESIVIVSLLNAIETGLLHPDDACFDFVYPIDLGFNNDITITVESREGLLEAAASQSSGFHVNSISYPFLVKSGDQLHSIQTEAAFREILNKCFISSFREFFDQRHKQCFGLVYPLTMLSNSGAEVTISSLDEFFTLYDTAGHDYQPQFGFPISFKFFAKEQTVEIKSYFDLYQALNDCKGCPELSISYTVSDHFRHKFTANVSDDVSSFDWYVDGAFVLTGIPASNTLEKTLLPGTHKICIKATTEDCVQGTEYCKELVVHEECPELTYTVENLGENLYKFKAIASENVPSFEWIINGDTVKTGTQADKELRHTFKSGFWNVCLKTQVNSCLEPVKYCEDFVICPHLSFDTAQNGDIYTYTATFREKDEIEYTWVVYIGSELIRFETEKPGDPDKDNTFSYQGFEQGVIYNVCIETEAGCEQVTRKCIEFSL